MLKRWSDLPPGIRWIAAIAGVVLALAIVWALFVPLADWLAHHDVGSVKGALHETALDNARGRLLTLGAGLFAAGALVFTARNFALSREGQVTDRYTKAIEQLGSDKLDVRIGGIYALERIARDSAKDHPTVMEVLTTFIREHSHEQWPPSDHPASRGQERSTRPDVHAALTVVGRRDPDHDIQRIDLIGTTLTGADLIGALLSRANLSRANLSRANLAGANLSRALLDDADLTHANLGNADLTGALLTGALLTGATLGVAGLTGAYLSGATLTGATLIGADLTGATLTGADLTGALLTGALLTGATLGVAGLTGATLTGVNLSAANLTNTRVGPDAVIPPRWQRDANSGRLKQVDPPTA